MSRVYFGASDVPPTRPQSVFLFLHFHAETTLTLGGDLLTAPSPPLICWWRHEAISAAQQVFPPQVVSPPSLWLP